MMFGDLPRKAEPCSHDDWLGNANGQGEQCPVVVHRAVVDGVPHDWLDRPALSVEVEVSDE